MTMLCAVTAIALGIAAAPLDQEQRPVRDVAATTRASAPPDSPPVASAMRAAQQPAIDGRDDDDAWKTAPRFTQFHQFEPEPSGAPSHPTDFRVVYDDDNLYVFVRAHDPHPDSIMRALTRRDVRGSSDQIKIIIDSFNDGRTGFQFAVNPDGVKRDFAVYDDTREDGSWNGVWDVATAVDSLGWTAEFRIPFSQLRYADAASHTFGFGVWRDIERYRERVSWPAFMRDQQGFMSQMGRLNGIDGISAGRPLEVTPYAVTKNVMRALPAGGFERAQEVSAGGDLKFGITPNVTLNATINPDFGQVEADPAVLNLGAFETFLGERRPFFVEGTGLYAFRLNCFAVADCATNEGLFYTRRIGRSPTLLGQYGDARTPASTPIAAAAKLTGRTEGGLSFGVMNAFTRHVDGADDATVEPRSNYAVVRAQQDLRGGDADIGFIATAVNRALDEWTEPVLHSSAYTAGISMRNRFARDYELAASFAASHVSGSADAILRTQRSAVHYYQMPGDDHEIDPARTSLSGHAEHVKLGKYGGGITRFETSLVRQSAGFEVNDLGYLRRADLLDWSTWGSLSFQSPTSVYRWLRLNGNHWQRWNTSGMRLNSAVNANAHVGLHNNWDLHAGATLEGLGDSFCDRCARGGPAVRVSPGFHPWFGVNADSRRTLAPSMWVNLSFMDGGRSQRVNISPSMNIRLLTGLQAQVGLSISNDDNDSQWFGNFTDDQGTTHYTFARLDQRTIALRMRVNYAVTPDLSFEFYGEPFTSSGSYSNVRELSATPDAADYDARLQPFTAPPEASTTFRFTQPRTNAVLRWEYLPGSTMYVVWAHGREAFENDVDRQSWRRDYRSLMDLHPDNTFLVKVSYWLNR